MIALVTRRLGPTHFGEYSLILAYGTILQLVADGGLYLTLSRELVHNTLSRATYSAQVLSLRVVLLLIVFILGGIGLWLWPTGHTLEQLFVVAAVGLSLQSMSQLLMGIYQVHGVVWRATVGDVMGRLAQVGLVWAWPQTSPLSMISAFMVSTAVAFALHAWLLPLPGLWRWAYDRAVWRRLLTVSWPLGLMLLMNVIYFRIDTVILSYWRTAAEVGQYNLAYRVIESALFFPAMFGGLLLPVISAALHRTHQQQARQLLNQSFRLLLTLAVLALLALQVGASWFVTWLAGPQFIAAAPLLKILALALATMFLGNLFGYVLVALQKQQALLWLYVGLAIGNTVANWLLVPHYGAAAAAWITVATEGIAMSVAGYLVHRALPLLIPLRVALSLAGTVAGTVGILNLVPYEWPMIIRLSVLLIIYGVLSWTLGLLRWPDIHLLLSRPTKLSAVPLPNETV